MKASWEKIEKNQGVLTVEVDAEQVAVGLDKAFKKVSAQVTVPGFRKGKVPRGMFEKRFGIESLYQDAIDFILPDAYMEAVKETGIEPIDRPEVDVEHIAKGEVLKFTAKVLVKPDVTLGEYKGIEVEEQNAEVSADEIDEELKRLQQRHAEVTVLEEGTAENGDITAIDFDGSVDGVPFEGGQSENYSLELGSGSFIPGFEEQIVGLAIGDEKDIEVTFPEDYHAEELKGKAAVFKVKVNEIKRKSLPALDDEFAKDVSEFDTLDEFKQDIEKRLKERKEQALKSERENAVIDKAAKAAEVEIPEVMIETEIGGMLQDFENRLRMQGMNLEMYYRFSGQDESKLREQMREDAEKRVRNNLVLEAIAKAESIEVSDEDLNSELENMAQQYQRSVEEIRTILSANGNLSAMKTDLIVRKTVDFLVANSKNVSSAA